MQKTQRSNSFKPEVSIIVVTYNSGELLRRCLLSLCNQTANCIEILIVDNGSTDTSSKIIIDEFAKTYNNIQTFYLENSLSIGEARNMALSHISGEYISFVDADDYVDSKLISHLLHRLKTDRSDLASCRYNIITADGKIHPNYVHPLFANERLIDNSSVEKQSQIIGGISPYLWNKLFKKTIIEEHHIQMPDVRYCEDYAFVLQYINYCKRLSFIDEPLYNYYAESSIGVTNSFNENWLDMPKAMQAIVDFYKEQNTFDLYEEALCSIALSTYAHRLRIMYSFNYNRIQQTQFVRDYQTFLLRNFNNVDGRMCELFPDIAKYSSTPRILAHIWSPSFLKFNPDITRLVTISNYRRKQKVPRIAYASLRSSMPIQDDKVLFIADDGPANTDSPYALLENLAKYGKFALYTVSRFPENDSTWFSERGLCVHVVEWESQEHLELLASVKYIITNTILPDYFSKRDGQKVLNTWHGAPLKTLGFDMKTPWKEIGNSQTKFMMSDYLLFPSEYARSKIMDSYQLDKLYTGKVLLCGYPRTSILLNDVTRSKVRTDLGLNGKRVFTYLPTWRGVGIYGKETAGHQQELYSLLKEVDTLLTDDVVVLVKLHRYMTNEAQEWLNGLTHVIPFDSRYETYEVLAAADGLITDYSSVLFDFATTRKPIFLFMYDYDNYANQRGFYLDPQMLPFEQTALPKDLALLINEANVKAPPSEAYEQFITEHCAYDTLDNAQRVNDAFFFGNETQIPISNYAHNAKNVWRAVLADNIFDHKEGRQFLETDLQPTDILVFSRRNFSEKTEAALRALQPLPTVVISVGYIPPMTIGENIRVRAFRKTGLLKGSVRTFYAKELQRLLPNITIDSIVCFSDAQQHRDIATLFQTPHDFDVLAHV